MNKLNIVIAHDLEARFPVEWLGLQQTSDNPKVYGNAAGVQLVVAGQGRQCAVAAVEYLAANQGRAVPTGWLNFGIAGHQSLAPCSTLVPDRILDSAVNETVYPAPIFAAANRGLLITVDEPEFNYPQQAAYDMEGAAYWAAATRHGNLELVQCLKVVSDNPEHSAEQLTKSKILEILDSARDDFLELVDSMSQVLTQLPAPLPFADLYASLKAKAHFTSTQSLQLERLLQRFHALGLHGELQTIAEGQHSDSRTLIGQLESALSGRR